MNLLFHTGTPDIPLRTMRRYWCVVDEHRDPADSASSRLRTKLLCYGNGFLMPLSDDQDEAPPHAVPFDDDSYTWTGWFEESCDQCDTHWTYTYEVVKWMALPMLKECLANPTVQP